MAGISFVENNFSVFPHCLQIQSKMRHFNARVGQTFVKLSDEMQYENGTRRIDHQSVAQEEHPFQGLLNFNTSARFRNNSTATNGDFLWALYSLTFVTIFFVIPIILMLYIYVRIWQEARRQKIKINNQYKPYFLPISPSTNYLGPGENYFNFICLH